MEESHADKSGNCNRAAGRSADRDNVRRGGREGSEGEEAEPADPWPARRKRRKDFAISAVAAGGTPAGFRFRGQHERRPYSLYHNNNASSLRVLFDFQAAEQFPQAYGSYPPAGKGAEAMGSVADQIAERNKRNI
jgi:hypothetical protein